jgi:DNA-binding NtrC family response regulator
MMTHHVVIIDDEPLTLKRLRRILEKEGYRISAFSSPQRALKHLERMACDLVISDIQMPGMNGLDLMAKVRSRSPDIEFILITGYASFDGAVEATKEGAFHYLAKPFTPDQLRQRVSQALSQLSTRAAARKATAATSQPLLPVIIGKSPQIRQVDALVRQVAPSDINVLITGEPGTGKELVGRVLHALSRRAKGPFVAFNCGALTESLIDNELFGHEKGAYAGAEDREPGLIEMAHGGTLFLDEIGAMPLATQVKLLRALQEKESIRVGGRNPIPLDVRLVTATSRDLKASVEDGTLRSDFFFKIDVFNIEVPPLNGRREDIPLLAYHILNGIRQRGGRKVTAISQKAMALLTNYAFPGNVRELENLLERAAAIAQDEIIRVSDLPGDLADLELQEYKRPERQPMTLEELEQDYIAHVLRLTDGARTRTAEILGIDRASLWRKIKKYGLE